MIRKRLDNMTRIDHLMEDPPPPKSLKIELTSRCNYQCRYCCRAQSPEDMDFDLFRSIASEAAALGIHEIGPFLIGEPFCAPDLLIQSVHFLRHSLATPYIFLTSNASLADSSSVRHCMDAGLDSLKWSVNFADADQFEHLSGTPSRFFDAALGNIKLAWEYRNLANSSTRLYASSILYNEAQRVRMEPLLRSRILPYVDDHYWLPLYSMSGAGKSVGKPTPGNTGRVDSPVSPLPCWAAFTAAHVRVDGTLTACPTDGLGRWVMGDLKRSSLMEAWHSPAFRALRRAHLRGSVTGTPCEDCLP